MLKAPPTPWALDPKIEFLNHGSFGSCPLPVIKEQDRLRRLMEAEPVRFLDRELEGRLDEARSALAAFIGADPDDIAFVPNATAGVNTVLRSLRFEPGDEILATDMEYNACRNAADFAVGGVRVRAARIPFPIGSPDEAAKAILACASERTHLALLSHITSPTGIILPLESLVRELQGRGIDVLVDGAHAPGQASLDLRRLDATYYTGNCHKWLCAPKGAAFLHVRRDRQERIRPLAISHGANSRRTDRSRFRLEADWTGTDDPTPYLCIPAAIQFMESAVPGGWPEVMRRNHSLTVEARKILADALGIPAPCPEVMLGAMAALPLPADLAGPPAPPKGLDPLQERLFSEFRIEVPIFPWPSP
ncbi:MAG: penicillin epimerase, partial [Elusimicrobia bacterium RIFOXYB2_FULL_62_6]